MPSSLNTVRAGAAPVAGLPAGAPALLPTSAYNNEAHGDGDVADKVKKVWIFSGKALDANWIPGNAAGIDNP